MPKVAFLLDGPGVSGGVNVVFRHAMELLRRGATVAIICKAPITRDDLAWHPIAEVFDAPKLLWLDYHQVTEHHFDLVIATWWRTFFDLWKIKADRHAYFVQSIESRFYPEHERVIRTAVDATYEAPIGLITEAKWIRDYLQRVHGQPAELALNGIDKSIFRPEGEAVSPRRPGRLRVLLEGPLHVPFKNVPASIRLAREGGADEIWLLTSTAVEKVDGVDRVFSRIPQAETAALYRSCDVLVKLSTVEGMFGPPLEMFHCGGTAIVYAVTGHDEYITHGRNALVAPMQDEAAVRAGIARLRQTPELLHHLQAGALATAAAWPDWTESGRQFEQGLQALLARPAMSRAALGSYSRRIWQLVDGHWAERAAWSAQPAAVPLHAVAGPGHAEDRLRHLEAVLAAILASSSWRVTRPARVAKRMLREKGYVKYVMQHAFDRARMMLG
jgi:glycosyltransferase involved in cell wall biosynthesis